MSKSIAQLFPLSEEKEHRIQADIPHTLFERADVIRKERRLKWNQIMQALLEKFVDDLTPKNTESFQLRKLNLDPESNRSAWK